MKKIYIIILSITFAGCLQDARYTQINDIHYKANRIIDDPGLLKLSVINSGDIQRYGTAAYDSVQRVQKEKSRQHKQRCKEFYRSPNYLINEVAAGMIMSAPFLSVRLPSVKTPRVVAAGTKLKKFKPKPYVPKMPKTIDYIIMEGNSHYGLCHIRNRHAPISYLLDGRVPTADTHLFMASSNSYIIRLIKQVNNGNIIRHGISKSNPANYHIVANMRNPFGVKRTYHLIIDRTTQNVVTFYPEGRLTSKMLMKINAPEYKALLREME